MAFRTYLVVLSGRGFEGFFDRPVLRNLPDQEVCEMEDLVVERVLHRSDANKLVAFRDFLKNDCISVVPRKVARVDYPLLVVVGRAQVADALYPVPWVLQETKVKIVSTANLKSFVHQLEARLNSLLG